MTRYLSAPVLKLLKTQLKPLLASQDALRQLAAVLDESRRNVTPHGRDPQRQPIEAEVVKLAIEMIGIMSDSAEASNAAAGYPTSTRGS